MKILHAVLSEGFYGSERYCAELAAEQAREGHDIEVLVENPWSDCAREMRKMVALAHTVGAGTLRLVCIPRWLPAWLHRPFARGVLRRFRPDIVHTHLNPAARRVGIPAQQLSIPCVSTLHISYERREHDPCDALIAIATWQRDGAPPEHRDKVFVVWPWLPASVQDALANLDSAEVAALRAQWRADDTVAVLGSVGRLAQEKGMDVLVKAFRAAFPHGDEPLRLVLVGNGDKRAEIEELAAPDPRIVVAGTQSNMALHYGAFDAFVSAARFEPFGIAIIEAMAAGLPLALTRTAGPIEFARDERIVWAELGDEATLTAALAQLVRQPLQRLTYDLKPFSPVHAAKEIEAVYRRLLARKHHGAGSASA